MKMAIARLLRSALSALLLLVLLALYLFARSRSVSKPKPGVKPRLAWVGAPVTNFKYASLALRGAGYFSRTVVHDYYSSIGEKSDFDVYRSELAFFYKWRPSLIPVVEPYVTFIYVLFRFDVLHFFYDGGVLAQTPLRFWEVELLHAFGKKVVVMPYGADVHMLSGMRNPVYKFGQLYHYGWSEIPRMALIRRWIDYFSLKADCCVGSAAFDALYRWDVLPVSYVAIDTELFRPPAHYESRHDGRNGPVTVVHTPNHRMIKGTEYIGAAIERLRAEGLQVEFRLLERMKNSEVRAILERADILVELLVSGYGLSAIEGMALGKPVISNFQGDTRALKYYSYLQECPIVQADIDTVYERLKWLVEHPAERREIGARSRRYAEKYHSYLSQQILWGEVYRKIWHGEDADLMLLFHPLLGRYDRLYEEGVAGMQHDCTQAGAA